MEGFFGTVVLQADEKCRYRVPSKFRIKMTDGKIFSMQNGSSYLSIISEEKANEIIAKLTPMVTIVDTESSDAARLLLSNLNEIKEDAQGRFTLPADVKQELNLGKEIVFVGMGAKIEMWDKTAFEAKSKQTKESAQFGSMLGKLSETTF